MAEPFVVAAAIARNRAWVLPRWATALYGQGRKPDAAYLLLNDCTDGSRLLLEGVSEQPGAWPAAFDVLNTGAEGYDRIAPRYSTANIARLRNELTGRVLARWPQATHLWSVDSDILPDPDVLEKLLAADKPVCAAVVRNSTAPVWNFWRGAQEFGWRGQPGYSWRPCRLGGRDNELAEELALGGDRPFSVTMTGACVLIRRDVLDAGVRYADNVDGEDVAWSMAAREKGFPLYVHPLARTRHAQRNGEEWR